MQFIIIFLTLVSALFLSACGQEKPEPETVVEQEAQVSDTITPPDDGGPKVLLADPMDIPDEAKQLHQQARDLGQAGQFPEAVKSLKQAIELAPGWPYPHYDLAFTYLLMENYPNALAEFKTVDELAPKGFLTTKTALWALEREARGMFPAGLYLAYVTLEWAPEDEKKEKTIALANNMPSFAPVWKDVAALTPNPTQRIQYIDSGLAAGPDAETYGILIINKAMALQQLGRPDQGAALLRALISNPDATLAATGIAQKTLLEMK